MAHNECLRARFTCCMTTENMESHKGKGNCQSEPLNTVGAEFFLFIFFLSELSSLHLSKVQATRY